MKLNINAKELLALYNVLHYRVWDERTVEGDDVHLQQVYNRIKSCLISALSDKRPDSFDAWLTQEQAKIDKLNEQLSGVKKEQSDLKNSNAVDAFNLDVGEDDFVPPEYPRRTVPNRSGRHGKKR